MSFKYQAYLLWKNLITLLIFIGTLPSHSQAQSPSDSSELQLPTALKPWVDWVKQELPDRDCARRDTQVACVWPTYLNFELKSDGAQFMMTGRLDQDELFPLPYAGDAWPSQVMIRAHDDQSWQKAPVLKVSQTPQLRLKQGEYLIKGMLTWDHLPDWIQTPSTVGFTHVQGVGVDPKGWVERDAQGRLWLRSHHLTAMSKDHQDSLHLQVFRVIYDEIPLRIETHVQLNTSGQAREVNLQGIELKGSTTVSLQSELTAEYKGQDLRIYLKPGRATLKLTSIMRLPSDTLSVPTISGGETSAQEIWVWHHNTELRNVSLSGLDMIDPDQTALPTHLKGGAYTFIASPGQVLKIKELNRGLTHPPSNELSLRRHLWLDLDGEGFVSRDRLQGQLNQGGRLNYNHPNRLGKVSTVHGSPLLITTDPNSGQEGFELRHSTVEIEAEIRSEQEGRSFDAVGWSLPVTALNLTLELPPGYRLLYAQGATHVTGSWFESWKMIDFFLILLTFVVFKKLFGLKIASLTLVMMSLYHKESIAPELTWILLCAAGVLIRILKGRFLRGVLYLYGAVVSISLCVMVFVAVHQDIRQALHPQLNQHTSNVFQDSSQNYEAEVALIPSRQISSKTNMKRKKWNKSYSQKSELSLQQLDPNAIVQTGPGLPNWRWLQYQLEFSGPVHPKHMVKLGLITPFWERILLMVRALLILFIFGTVMKWLWKVHQQGRTELDEALGKSTNEQLKQSSNTLLVLILISSIVVSIPSGFAQEIQQQSNMDSSQIFQQQSTMPSENFQEVGSLPQVSSTQSVRSDELFPSSELLNTLKKRIQKQYDCLGNCLYLPKFDLKIDHQKLILQAEVHAERSTSFTLPGSLQKVHWHQVELNGTALPTRGVLRGEELSLVVRIPQGQHFITAQATLPPLSSLNLAIYDRPQQLSLDLQGWGLESSKDKVEGTLELRRIKSQNDTLTQSAQEPPDQPQERAWYQITRALIIGLPWQVETTISRPYTVNLGAQALTIPLLEGERLLSPEVSLTNEGARIQFSEGQSSLSFISELTPRSTLKLLAPDADLWSETWVLNCGLIWQCTWKGLNPDNTTSGVNGARWSPWPGEEVTLSFARPQGVKGPAATIQHAKLIIEPGEQLVKGTIHLELNASRGGARRLTLPQGVKDVRLYINHQERHDPLEGQEVRLPFQPGVNHFRITWSDLSSSQTIISSPKIKLDGTLVNLELSILKPSHRWLIWTSGPPWGPAVLFYGFIVFCILLAFGIHRSALTPLPFKTWVLLLLGFTQAPLSILGVLVWFIAFELRGRYYERFNPYLLNLYQIALGFGTIVFFFVLYWSIQTNLLGNVDMQISGAGSTEYKLNWYLDRTEGSFPIAKLYTLPNWFWKVLMLAWSLWLANRLISWLQWAWEQFQIGGVWHSTSANKPQHRQQRSDLNE